MWVVWVLQDEEERATSTGGDFMPLSYWEKMGLDPKRIIDNTQPEDVEWSDQLGWTYRVIIKGQKKTVKKSQREMLSIVNARKRRSSALPIGAPQPKAVCVGEPTQVSGKPTQKPPSSSSDGSSSSDDDASSGESQQEAEEVTLPVPEVPTRAAAKAAVAKAKAQAKAAAAKAKAQAKATEQGKKKAATLRRKLVAALNGLRNAVSHPLILEVPAKVSDKVQSFLVAFERMVNSCDLVIAGATMELDAALDQVPWKEVKAAENCCSAFLRPSRRHDSWNCESGHRQGVSGRPTHSSRETATRQEEEET